MTTVWQRLGRLQAAHVVMLRDAGMIDDDALAGSLGAIERVASSEPAEHDTLLAAIRAFDERVDGNLAAGLRGTNRVGRGTIDLAAAALRIQLRESALQVAERTAAGRRELIDLASAHVVTLMPVMVAGQPAQPSTLGHLLAGVVSQLRRADDELARAYEALNRSPLGAGSLASSGMPIDRERLTDLAGFDGLIENTFDAVSAVDHQSSFASAVHAVVAPLHRLVGELLAWTRAESTSLLFGDAWVARIDDLPQAQSPLGVEALHSQLADVLALALELHRAVDSIGFGPVTGDLDRLGELSDQLANRAGESVQRTIELLTVGMQVNRALMANRAGKGFSTSSDLADFLMVEEQIDPGAAQNIAALTISRAREQGLEAAGITVDLIDGAALLVIGREIKVEFEAISRYLAPRRFIERRTAPGGPSPATVRAHLESEKARLAESGARWQAAQDRLDRAATELARIEAEAASAGA